MNLPPEYDPEGKDPIENLLWLAIALLVIGLGLAAVDWLSSIH